MINDNDRYLKETQLIDQFATFVLRYKMNVEPQNRSEANNMLERILDLLYSYQDERKKLVESLEATKDLSEKISVEKKAAENKVNQIYDDIQSLLNLPFEGKRNDLAHERIGQDKIINYILVEILEKYKKSCINR